MSDLAKKKGLFNLVLNAHLPYKASDDSGDFFQERWLYRAILETYLPFLNRFKLLQQENIPFKFTLVISPTLALMLLDEAIQQRFRLYLTQQLSLAEAELDRTKPDPLLHSTAVIYYQNYRDAIDQYQEYHGNILKEFSNLVSSGHCEIIATAATFSYLPLYQSYERAVHAQVKTAIEQFKRIFGYAPHGFWLPHCGYYPGLEDILSSYGISYFYTASHALLDAPEQAKSAIYEPIEVAGSGCSAFARDRLSGRKVLDSHKGYSTHGSYREYYHDIGYNLPLDYVSRHHAESDQRSATGFKYMAITSKFGEKEYYNHAKAMEQVEKDAENFVLHLNTTWQQAQDYMDKAPLIVATYDMEFFGQWWFEGVDFIDQVLRNLARQEDVMVLTASDYLGRFCDFQQMQPSLSSWGRADAYNQLWLDESNSWMLRHIFRAIDSMTELAQRFPDASGLKKRILNQAAREVLLMMASDWPLMLRNGSNEFFVIDQIRGNLENFYKIYDAMSRNTIQTSWLTALEKEDHIFSDSINYLIFL